MQRFLKGIFYNEKGELIKDYTIDVSTGYSIFEYGVLNVNDSRVKNTMDSVINSLRVKTDIGGFARYEHDKYHFVDDKVIGNPWFVSILWIAEYYIAKAKNKREMKNAYDLMRWVSMRSLPSGILSEQINPYTGEPLSVAPLIWSHAGFIIASMKYLDKMKKIRN